MNLCKYCRWENWCTKVQLFLLFNFISHCFQNSNNNQATLPLCSNWLLHSKPDSSKLRVCATFSYMNLSITFNMLPQTANIKPFKSANPAVVYHARQLHKQIYEVLISTVSSIQTTHKAKVRAKIMPSRFAKL